ncbi:anti-sigma factor family protein [Micromonospora sp. IBHARD004]|uniref:anti-sigma factor family protein n=1 Tax=Micromonospora sp. IBHARD004 TaxID=3457764 RepID=UPI0040582DF2
MTAEPPCTFTTSLASLLIGALGPLERQEVEAHLRQCPVCLEELILLAPLPGLLHRAAPPDSCPRCDP